MEIYRQGDVLLIPVAAIPDGTKAVVRDQRGRLVLAEGEVTGHAHVILDESCELVTADEAAELYLLVHGTEPVELFHEEHATISVPPGQYETRILREYQPDAIRNVYD